MNRREDRWVDVGELAQGSWGIPGTDATFEVGPPIEDGCRGAAVEDGQPCQLDCDCADDSHCLPDLAAGTCERRCSRLACGTEPECLQGRCRSEMDPYVAQCQSSFADCASDETCPATQDCEDGRCAFPWFQPLTDCTTGTQCPAGWSCVVTAPGAVEGKCAIRCYTDRTPCPDGRCSKLPGAPLRWICR